MNNRDYKHSEKNGIYHIFNKGTGGENIFKSSTDYSFFTYRLRQYLFPSEEIAVPGSRITFLPDKSFSLLCYCLMPNHFHLIFRQESDLPLPLLMLKLTTSYSKYFNAKYKRLGHLFQDRYRQVPIVGDRQLMWISAYIHQNPKKSKLIADAAKYNWSSYPDYVAESSYSLVAGSQQILKHFKNRREYQYFVEDSFKLLDEKDILKGITIDYD